MKTSSPWIETQPLLLASTSQTRRMLLEHAGIPVETTASGVDERGVEDASRHEGMPPLALAQRLALAKAIAVSERRPDRLVLGGDQVLDCEGMTFHKAGTRQEAARQLERLAGRTHALHAAGALARNGTLVAAFDATAYLTMRQLGPDGIERYLDLVAPDTLASIGIYQVEAVGIHLFDRIEGDHSTILGLPLLPLLAALRTLGCLAF